MRTMLHVVPIACVLAWALIVPNATPVAAHPADNLPPDSIQSTGGHDRPGAPPIITEVGLAQILYPKKLWDDDAGSYAEMVVTTLVYHKDHGMESWWWANDRIRWPDDFGQWVINRKIYSHLECSPMNDIRLVLFGTEVDAAGLSDEEERLLKQVVDLCVSDKYIIGRWLVMKLLRGFFAWINPDDDLGVGEVEAPFPGLYRIDTGLGDYSIRGDYYVQTSVQNTNDCDPDTPVPVSEGPNFGFSLNRLDSLGTIWTEAESIKAEPGQSYLSPQDIEDTKSSVRSLTLGVVRWTTARMLEQAQPHYGFSSALYYFNRAETETGTTAIADYRYATYLAEYALENFSIDPNAAPMPPVVVALPTFMATRSGRSIEYLIGAFGTNAHSVSIATVTGGPPGAFYTIQNPDPDYPWLQVLHVDQDAPAGTYPFQVTFNGELATSAGAQSAAAVAPLTLTIDVDDPPAVTGVEDRSLPDGFELSGVRPSPVLTAGAVRVDVPVESRVSLALFDVAGHRVRPVKGDQVMGAGTGVFRIDVQGLAAGVYYLRLLAQPTAGGAPFRATRSVIVTR